MKKYQILVLIITILITYSSAESKEKKSEPIFFTFVKGSMKDYIPDSLNLEIKDMQYYSNAYYGGSLYILSNTKGYHDFYVTAEREILEDFIKKAKEICKDYLFFGLDHFDIKVTAIEKNILLTASVNILCMDFKKKIGGRSK